jgi:arabinose-5-phosphate isomerase
VGAKTATPDMLAAEALRIMEENEISSLVVLDQPGKIAGVIHLIHLLHAGIA